MMYDDAGWGWWVMGAVVLVVLLFLVAGALAVVLAVHPRPGQAGTTSERASHAPAAALEALDVRFARGEVDEETYRRSRDLLVRPPGW
jgi:uncharacterized membrane protein